MKTVCIDARMLEAGGIGTYLQQLIPRLPFSLTLIVPSSLPRRFPWLNHYTLRLCDTPIYSIAEQYQLPRLIPPSDVFFSPHFNIPLLPIRAKARLTTIHDTYHLTYAAKLRPLEQCYAYVMYRAAAQRSNQIITVSTFSKNEIARHIKIKPEKISVIHHGVNPHQLQTHKREKWILFVGNVKPHKNLNHLIQACRSFPDYTLLIVGKNDGFIHGTSLESSDRINCLGHVEEAKLISLYQQASVCVLPSFYEGFGLPALEAMSFDCPLVVSNIPSLIEVCGPCAVYVDPHDPSDIARGIQLALHTPAPGGFLRSTQFSWEKSARDHTRLIDQIN